MSRDGIPDVHLEGSHQQDKADAPKLQRSGFNPEAGRC